MIFPPSIPGTSLPSPFGPTHPVSTEAGTGIAVLVNANAKRGGRRIAAELHRHLPAATIRLTRRISEMDELLPRLRDSRCILAAGGDGTAVALMNAMHRTTPPDELFPPAGVLPLGTGNAWAHVTGSRRLAWCVDRLADSKDPLPFRRYGLVECDGVLCHFAGSGWDSEILEDYKAQLLAARGPTRRFAKSVYGYLSASVLRSAPKALVLGRPHVIVENLGDDVFTVSADGKLLRIAGAKHGQVLYDGPACVAGAATCPEFGYRFRAYPFAERLPGYINVRVYNTHVLTALASLRDLWRGAHPLPGMYDWFVKAARMTFSRPVSLQIGGDAHGIRQTVEYRASSRVVRLLDWRRLG